jgi:hypothetical protein
MSRQKELKELKRLAELQGWTILRTNGDHLKWISPENAIVFSALTPSDNRAIKNHKSVLKRHGFVVQDSRSK